MTPTAHIATQGIYLYAVSGNAMRVYDARATAEPILQRTYLGLSEIENIAAAGDRLLITSSGPGPDLVVLDIAAPRFPAETGNVGTAGSTAQAIADGDAVWLATGFAGLRRFDLTTTGALIPRGGTMTLADPTVLQLDDDRLVAGGRSGWAIYTPEGNNARSVSETIPDRDVRGIAIDGEQVAVALGNRGIALYNISDPTSPVHIANTETRGPATGVAMSANYVYASDAGGISIFDRRFLHPATRLDTPAPAQAIRIRGIYGYIPLSNGAMAIAELSDPDGGIEQVGNVQTRLPTHLLTAPDGRLYGVADDLVIRLFVQDNGRMGITASDALPEIVQDAFFTPEGLLGTLGADNRLRLYDVNRLRDDGLSSRGTYSLSVDDRPVNAVAVRERNGYIAYADGALGWTNLNAPGIVALFAPDVVTTLRIDQDVMFALGATDVNAYEVAAWDVSGDAAPALLDRLPLLAPGRNIDIQPDGRLLISTERGGTIAHWDGATFAIVGELTSEAANGATLIGNRLYAALDRGGLLIADATDLTRPTPLFTITSDAGRFPVDVMTVAETQVAVSWEGGIDVLNVPEVSTPPRLITATTGGVTSASDVFLAADGTRAVVARGADGVVIVDVSNNAALETIGSINTTGEALAAVLDVEHVYVADGICGLSVYDVSNPGMPREVAKWTDGFIADVVLSKDGLIRAAGENHLYTFQFNASAMPDTPPAPRKPSPETEASAVPLDTILRWEPPADPCDPLDYRVYFGPNDDPPLMGQIMREPLLEVGELAPLRTYHWRVEATNARDGINTGPQWSFRTETAAIEDAVPPAPPVFVENLREYPVVSASLFGLLVLSAGASGAYIWLRRQQPPDTPIPDWYSTTQAEEDDFVW